MMNREKYYNFIKGKLAALAISIENDGRLNILSQHVHSEEFFSQLLNLLYGWNFTNLNKKNRNMPGIDLVDVNKKIVAQVSATADKRKIESALKKVHSNYNSFSFKFISISKDAEKLRKNKFACPPDLKFTPIEDILDISSLLKDIKVLDIDQMKKVHKFIINELGGEPESRDASPHGIPFPASDFVGRKQDISKLMDILSQATDNDAEAVICGIRGMGGIGKTQLAYEVARRVAQSFRNGQVFVDLRGERSTSLSPEQALKAVIKALDSKAGLPDERGVLRNVYNSLIEKKKVLILADSAKNSDQVKDLNPRAGSALLITSRQTFIMEGMRGPIELLKLPLEEAEQYLRHTCPRIGDSAEKLAELCGCLPLALRISANQLKIDDTITVDGYLKALKKNRMNILSDPDDPNNPDVSVKASFNLSYLALDEPQKSLLRQISVFPGTFTLSAIEKIVVLPDPNNTDDKATKVQEAFSFLRRFSLVEKKEGTERYLLHDLIRDFAKNELNNNRNEHINTEQRYLEHYLEYAKDKWDSKDMTALETEQANIIQGLDYAYNSWNENLTDDGLASLIISTVKTFGIYLSSKGSHQARIDWGEKALIIAEHTKNVEAIAHLCAYIISWAQLQQGKYEQAREFSKKGLKAARKCSNMEMAGYASHIIAGYERDAKKPNVRKAKYWADRTLFYAEKSENERLRRHGVLDLGYAYLIKQTSNGYTKAEQLFKELMALEEVDYKKNKRNAEMLANRFMDVAHALLNKKDFDTARELYGKALDLAEEVDHLTAVGEAKFGLSKIEEACDKKQSARKLALEAREKFNRAGINRLSRAEQFCYLDAKGKE